MRHLLVRLIILSMAALCVLVVIVPASAQNLIANGAFASGGASWTVGGNDVLYYGTEGISGAVFNAGNGSPGTTLKQTIATTAGQYYAVSFEYEHYDATASQPGTILLTVNDVASGINELYQAAATTTNTASTYTFYFMAVASSTSIQFSDALETGADALNADDVITNVSVTASTPANNITNGTFENSSGQQVNTGSVPDWTVGGADNIWFYNEGEFGAVFSAGSVASGTVITSGSTLTQTITTVKGQFYVGNFDYVRTGGWSGTATIPGLITVSATDATSGATLVNKPVSTTLTSINTYTFYFTAQGASTTLTFTNTGETACSSTADTIANVMVYLGVAPTSNALPFVMPSTSTLESSSHKVFAHYVPWETLSYSNNSPLDPTVDWYATVSNPNGDSGAFLPTGGMLRDRAYPVAPQNSSVQYTIVDFESEIQHAIADGFDGFDVDLVQSYSSWTSSGSSTLGSWYIATQLMSAAAAYNKANGTSFQILLVPDMTSSGSYSPSADPNGTTLAADMTKLSNTTNYPAVYHNGTTLVVAPFTPECEGSATQTPAQWWQTWLATMSTDGVTVDLIPIWQGEQQSPGLNDGSTQPTNPSWASICYGFSDWGDIDPLLCDIYYEVNNSGDSPTSLSSTYVNDVNVHDNASIAKWMAPCSAEFDKPAGKYNNGVAPGIYTEAENTTNARETWSDACDLPYTTTDNLTNGIPTNWAQTEPYTKKSSLSSWTPADLVNSVTWNDYLEGSVCAPTPGTQNLFGDLTAYFITALKNNGTPPTITRDALYYCHRNQYAYAPGAGAPYNHSLQTGGDFQPMSGAQALANNIEVLAFLTAPGTVEVNLAGVTTSFSASAGFSTFTVPLTLTNNVLTASVVPNFKLLRGTGSAQHVVTSVTSEFPITQYPSVQDFYYYGGSDLRAYDTTVLDTDPLMSYNNTGATSSGSWQAEKTAAYTYHATQAYGDFVEYSFVGTGIDLIADKNSSEGNITVTIDPQLTPVSYKQEVSCNASALEPQQTAFSYTGLPYGVHTLYATKSDNNTSVIVIDGLKVHK